MKTYKAWSCMEHGTQVAGDGLRLTGCPLCFPEDIVKEAIGRDEKGVNQAQVGGSHYKDKAIQPWDYIVSNGLGYLEGNIVKYVSRYKEKNGLEDLKKARHYLDKLIETQEGK